MTLKQENETLRAALKVAIVALDDWTNIYAPVFCDKQRTKEALERFQEGGILDYIARTVTQCRDALERKK